MRLMDDIRAVSIGKGQDGSFKLERITEGKRAVVKVESTSSKGHLYDYVYSRGLPVILKEAVDCFKTPWYSVRQLMLAAGCSNLYTLNVKNGVVTYKTFAKVRDLLKPYKNLLSSWDSFIHIYYIPRNQQIVWKTRYAVHTDTLKSYHAGSRAVITKRRKASKMEDKNITVFTDFGKGVYVKSDHTKNIVIHNLGGAPIAEDMRSFAEEFKHSACRRTVLYNGIEYTLTTKEV